jgi:hypothetical protein
MNYYSVEGHSHLKRDPKTNSIINTNMSQYQEYLNKRDKKTEENQKLQNLESDIVNMKEDLNEIKNLLRNLVNGS